MNALIVAVDHTSASRQRAASAARLAASMNLPLHLVFGTGARLCDTFASGSDRYFVDTERLADTVLADLSKQLESITTITCSTVATSPSAAIRKEAKRLEASPVVLNLSTVGRLVARFRSEARRPVRCPARVSVSAVAGA
jgi:hypothetical protein